MALSRISAGLLPDSLACTPSRAAARPSLVPKPVASALMSSFGPEVLASSNAHPLDRLSFRSPHKPLGSAAVTASGHHGALQELGPFVRGEACLVGHG